MEKKSNLNQEFLEFMAVDGVPVSEVLSDTILTKVQADLNPPAASVFMKLSLIHVFVGLLTLAYCPQFGMSLTSSMGLMHYLMQYGDAVCMMGCGALFTGASLLVASLVLKPEEVKVLRKNRVLQLTSLATLSLGIFVCIGAEVVGTLALVWMFGGVLGGSGLLQLGWNVRKFAARAF